MRCFLTSPEVGGALPGQRGAPNCRLLETHRADSHKPLTSLSSMRFHSSFSRNKTTTTSGRRADSQTSHTHLIVLFNYGCAVGIKHIVILFYCKKNRQSQMPDKDVKKKKGGGVQPLSATQYGQDHLHFETRDSSSPPPRPCR